MASSARFTRYEGFVIAVLAILQFTIILDFMVLSPLGAILMPTLHITPVQFGWVVSAYAFSAGASGLLAAGFADNFDRKKLLLFFYTGFTLGTFLCSIATDYHFLLFARIFTGLFGGVIGSICSAIITDLFALEVRGRVMGFVQMAFATSQVLGIPIGLYLANEFGWHSPFTMIVLFCIVIGILILVYLKPIDKHLGLNTEHNAFKHLGQTLSQSNYLLAFATTTLLAMGGYMLMPFGSAFSVHNLKIPFDKLPMVYIVTGISSMIAGPLLGKYSDVIGKYRLFVMGSILSMIMTGIYGNLGPTPIWIVIVINVFLFMGITSRIISSSALMTAIPKPQDRGAFMSINASVQQMAGGLAAAAAGFIVSETPSGYIEHYDRLSYVVIAGSMLAIVMMYFVNQMVQRKLATPAVPV
ncbi:MFS transporter [Siphonobacter sp. BAB-5405]|uniref:MFS transporter n=1 Tax=Siphonobacter sp. BAB-5405 TaxID=1864825 RepID=UPI000C7FF332|nr:MFS transporter [Siphonobacter sp. BAB-5405]PMD97532.1 MFS transporter [Siphonobacter sp. BAB-5405]